MRNYYRFMFYIIIPLIIITNEFSIQQYTVLQNLL